MYTTHTVIATLRQLIQNSGVTYTFLSRQTGIPTDALSRSMHGKRDLKAEELLAICRVIHIPLGPFAEER